MSLQTEPAAPASRRLDSLDAFRGLTIAGMILVNNPGTWSSIYAPLRHAEWHGCTPTDLVFPFFLFIVGVAIELSLSRRVERGDSRRDLLIKVATRSLILFAIGLFLNGFPYFNLAKLRIPGVLQRIAVCYAFAAALRLFMPTRALVAIAAALLLGYWGLLEFTPPPGGVAGDLTREGSLPSWFDRQIFGAHTYKPEYDPEGLLSTIPAIGTTLIGIFVGAWLKSGRSGRSKVLGLIGGGLLLAVVGWLWDRAFPINKALWTSSFVVFTAGWAAFLLGCMYLIIDRLGWRRWSWPLRVFGLNPILAFVGSGLVARLMGLIHIPSGGKSVTLKAAIYQGAFGSIGDPQLASLLFAIAYVLFWFLLMWPLERRGIAVRV
ncbi:MAG: DUF5009 domain-containing protein [Isosphaeraceae bacterium]